MFPHLPCYIQLSVIYSLWLPTHRCGIRFTTLVSLLMSTLLIERFRKRCTLILIAFIRLQTVCLFSVHDIYSVLELTLVSGDFSTLNVKKVLLTQLGQDGTLVIFLLYDLLIDLMVYNVVIQVCI